MTRRTRTPKPAAPSPLDRFGGKNPQRLDPTDETAVLTVKVPARLLRALDAVAARTGETRSAIARRLLLETTELGR